MVKPRPVVVYRTRNDLGLIIYVGITKHWPTRWWQHHRTNRVLVGETVRVEIYYCGSRREARHVEADLISSCQPRWNYQRPNLIKLEYRCQRCGMLSASWRVMSGEECYDMSGVGGSDTPCHGILVPAVTRCDISDRA